MGRGSTQILIRKIVESLAKGPKSATEIANETGLDRTAILRYLDLLRSSNFVAEQKDKVSRKFILSSNYRLDTYFGLPLKKQTDEMINSIYHTIRAAWEKKTGRKLLKTTSQKIMYKIIKQCNLEEIPIGWYIFGGVCVKPYDYNDPYDFKGLSNGILSCVRETVLEYSKNEFAYQSRKQQYDEEQKPLYIIKEEILKLIYSNNFSIRSMFVFQKLYSKLMKLLPEGDSMYNELISDYTTLLIDITKYWSDFIDEKDDIKFAEFKQKLIRSFECLWKLAAMHQFKEDLKKFYLEKELDEHFKLDIAQSKEELMESGSELNEMIPFEEPDEPLYGKIKEALNKINKPANQKKLRKQREELEKVLKGKRRDAYNKELFRRFGLD